MPSSKVSRMSRAAWSVLIFGLYMIGEGALLMLVPRLLLSAVGAPIPADAWVRVVGWCLIVLGVYYVLLARLEQRIFFSVSAVVRLLQFGFFVALWAASLIKPVMLGFSAVELASGIWTLAVLNAKTEQ
jgi:hypothetical protein